MPEKGARHGSTGAAPGEQVADKYAVFSPAQPPAGEAFELRWVWMPGVRGELRGHQNHSRTASAAGQVCCLLSRTGERLSPIIPRATQEGPIPTIRVSRVNLFRGSARDYPWMSRKALHAHSLF